MQSAIIENEPLAKYTSWRIGGPARYFAGARSPDQVRELLGWARERDLPVCLLGGGTNVLVRDTGFAGLVLRYRAQDMRVEPHPGGAWAWVAAGAPMAGTARRLAGLGWAGLQWAEGLPGTIGGAVFGNAGCYGGDIASALVRAWLLVDGVLEEWPVERFAYAYRTSALKAHATTDDRRPTTDAPEPRTENQEPMTIHPDKVTRRQGDKLTESGEAVTPSPLHPFTVSGQPVVGGQWSVVSGRWSAPGPIVVAAEFNLTAADPRELAEQMEQTALARRGKTPAGQSCGSVFKNPPGDSAGRLIEAARLKRTRVGAAEISEKHANYIVNQGGASSEDVLQLITITHERVMQEFGIALELEVQVIG